MLKCKQVQQQASRYVDGDCGFFMRLQMQMHILLCKHCRSFIKKIKLTKFFVAMLPVKAASKKQVAHVMSHIESMDSDC